MLFYATWILMLEAVRLNGGGGCVLLSACWRNLSKGGSGEDGVGSEDRESDEAGDDGCGAGVSIYLRRLDSGLYV